MMNNILSEKEYQHFIMERLEKDNGYVIRKATSYDRLFAMDREMLFQFLNDTQPEAMDALRKIYKADLEDTIVSFINAEATKARGSLLALLKHGLEISNMKLELMYTKPATDFNRELLAKYDKNIFSVMEEVWASDDERIDLVIFLNGIAIMSFELKCNAAGQSYQDAIYQYRVDRNPKTRLFWFKAGCLVNFAMDLEEVYMTTKLAGNATFFLPFNMGNGEGVNAGAGNPTFEDKYSVSYMWEDILTKNTVLDLISKFIFIESKETEDELTGKKKTSENVIFPRYHQLDVIRKVLADVRENRTSQNYLIQHSAGSGKTNSIAWLAHRLTSLHDADNKIIFDNLPSVSVESVEYNDCLLDVLVVHNTDRTPLFLKKPYGKMRQGCIYARVGDRNTPDYGNAEIDVIENLWKKRLGLTKTPLAYIFDALANKLEWAESENGYYHIYKPEFTIEREDDIAFKRGADEFYSYAQTNESTSYYMLDVKAKGTTLERQQIVNLDSGRLSIPVPEWGFVYFDGYHQDVVGFKYYVQDSHSETLLKFMYDPEDGEQRWAFRKFERITLFFTSDDEKDSFEKYVELHLGELKSRIEASNEFEYIATESETKTAEYKRSLRTAIELKAMLEEFRQSCQV